MLSVNFLFGFSRDDGWQTSMTLLKDKWKTSSFCDIDRGNKLEKEEIKDPYISSDPVILPTTAYQHDPEPAQEKAEEPQQEERRANAAFVFLARNSELRSVIESLQQMEDRFNKKFKYPYV